MIIITGDGSVYSSFCRPRSNQFND